METSASQLEYAIIGNGMEDKLKTWNALKTPTKLIGNCSYCVHLLVDIRDDPCVNCDAFHNTDGYVKGNWVWDKTHE